MMLKMDRRALLAGILANSAVQLLPSSLAAQGADPLPSWNEGASKRALLDFVAAVTTQGSPDYVAPAARIAVFDNDGTLWCEHPMYVQLAFAIDRVKALAPAHPQWAQQMPFKAVLDGDLQALAASGTHGLVDLVMATHAGMNVDAFAALVTDWLATARHPRFQRPYTDLTYQPMIEVLTYLRAQGFQTFIVSGGGTDFMRPWTERVYGVPPNQVVGSSLKTRFEIENQKPVLKALPEVNFVDDGPGKPVGIHSHIGMRPIAAFGNSDGDFEMLQWTSMAPQRRLGMIVHHTDAVREYAYDRNTSFGRLNRALDAAPANGWTLINMKEDWKRIFAWQG
jgi:phosphoglycolate phosphatase-like HAD superfamily hydrolase